MSDELFDGNIASEMTLDKADGLDVIFDKHMSDRHGKYIVFCGACATFEFTVTHVGPCTGTVEVNESISYDDAEGNVVTFPSPVIEVDCGVDVCPKG